MKKIPTISFLPFSVVCATSDTGGKEYERNCILHLCWNGFVCNFELGLQPCLNLLMKPTNSFKEREASLFFERVLGASP